MKLTFLPTFSLIPASSAGIQKAPTSSRQKQIDKVIQNIPVIDAPPTVIRRWIANWFSAFSNDPCAENHVTSINKVSWTGAKVQLSFEDELIKDLLSWGFDYPDVAGILNAIDEARIAENKRRVINEFLTSIEHRLHQLDYHALNTTTVRIRQRSKYRATTTNSSMWSKVYVCLQVELFLFVGSLLLASVAKYGFGFEIDAYDLVGQLGSVLVMGFVYTYALM
ncbi:hypothetical protein EG329_000560 [Mollisiaceae sp. DMI_Dod_QoI]|nr:hypothetical protein EG329_000560 [Helotiales sp. DMI_Dod_QoI]